MATTPFVSTRVGGGYTWYRFELTSSYNLGPIPNPWPGYSFISTGAQVRLARYTDPDNRAFGVNFIIRDTGGNALYSRPEYVGAIIGISYSTGGEMRVLGPTPWQTSFPADFTNADHITIHNAAGGTGNQSIEIASVEVRVCRGEVITPTPTPTGGPIVVCIGTINTKSTSGFGVRSEPSLGAQRVDTLTNGFTISLLGKAPPNAIETYVWYKIEYFKDSTTKHGWVRSDGVEAGTECNGVSFIDPNTNEQVLPPHDYELSEAPPVEWANLSCTAEDDEENHKRCARVVYLEYYNQFVVLNQRKPNISDVLAAIAYVELGGVAIPAQVPLGINTRSNKTGNEIATEAIASKYWGIVVTVFGNQNGNLALEDLTDIYLASFQGWYQTPITTVESKLIKEPRKHMNKAWQILSSQVTVDINSVREWGNVPFGINTGYNELYTNNQVAYCYTYRKFINSDGNKNLLTQQDYWNDYRFVFIVGISLGSGYVIDTYDQNRHQAPAWLTQVGGRDNHEEYLNCSLNVGEAPNF